MLLRSSTRYSIQITKDNLESSIMALRNDIGFTGVPDFKVIDIDPFVVASCLQSYIDRGSKLTGVSIEDISLSVNPVPSDIKKVTLVELLECGMKLFDAIVWLTAGRPSDKPLELDNDISKENIPSLHQIASAVFYVYFFLLTQARYPIRAGDGNPPKVPNFLNTVMGLSEPQGVYVDRICTFNPVKFDAKWAESISFSGLGQETMSRFGLGVAGYRLFGPFKLYDHKAGISDDLKKAYSFARKVSMAPPTWDIHPLTRDPTVLVKRGNLNKNLGNLILDVFTDQQIDEMVSAKVIFAKPLREPSYRNYYQWDEEDNISGSTAIFPTSQ